MNTFMNELVKQSNYTLTENGALTHKTTFNSVLDLFAMGAAFRNRTDEDCILLFKNAYEQDPELALKCLFYIRDIRGGQGERRFFRVCLKWLANYAPSAVIFNLSMIPEYGRWDDFYCLIETKAEEHMWKFVKEQFILDLNSTTPSLLGKWLKSENASSAETRKLGKKTRKMFELTPRAYRQFLSQLRSRINIVEKLMSENRWNEIEFDKIPSKAGLKYKNAFARRDIIREKYIKFIQSEDTKVNTETLYPYEIVSDALYNRRGDPIGRDVINKYWNNLTDYFNGQSLNGICVIDTSGSMTGRPISVAISLGLYCAERNSGPFKDYFISFASRPQLIKTEGVDFVDKVCRIWEKSLIDNTNIEAVFDLILNVAIGKNCAKEDIPKNVIIISDMEFDQARTNRWGVSQEVLFETINRKWEEAGIQMPHLIFWNVDARQNNIPLIDNSKPISYVSGFSPTIFSTIMSGKSGVELMLEKLNSERYSAIKSPKSI